MTTTATRVAVYARISEDPLNKEDGVRRQVEDCLRLAAERGWEVVAEPLVDNDVSALNGKHRPRYQELLALVERKAVDQVVVFQTSRIWRNRRERADGIDLFSKSKVGLCAVKGQHLDLSSAQGRGMASMMGEVDTMESEIKAERVAAAAAHRAAEGRPSGSIPFGWSRQYVRDGRGNVISSYDVENPAEAPVVREIVDRLLRGDSIKTIVSDLNDRAIPSPLGKAWRPSSARKIALRESNAARRVHQGVVIGKAAWPALVDDDTHDRVVALLTDPSRQTSRDGARKHLLSYGVGECGLCGDNLRVVTKRITRTVAKARTEDNPEGKVVAEHGLYVCDTKGCVGRSQKQVDSLVEAVVVRRLRRPDAAGLVTKDDGAAREAQDRAEGLRARLAAAADDYAAELLTREQLLRITASLRPQLEVAEAEARRHLSPSLAALAEVTDGDVEQRWSELTLTRKRQVFDALGMRVRIMPARKGAGFDPDSVDVIWKTK